MWCVVCRTVLTIGTAACRACSKLNTATISVLVCHMCILTQLSVLYVLPSINKFYCRGVQSIGDSAFERATALTSAFIPS